MTKQMIVKLGKDFSKKVAKKAVVGITAELVIHFGSKVLINAIDKDCKKVQKYDGKLINIEA